MREPSLQSVSPKLRPWLIAAAVLVCLVATLGLTESTGTTHLVASLVRFIGPNPAPLASNPTPAATPPRAADWPVGLIRKHDWLGREAHHTNFSPDGRYYAATGSTRAPQTVRVWELATGKLVFEFPGFGDAVFTADSKRIMAPRIDRQIHIWDLAKQTELGKFGEHPDTIRMGALSDDGMQLLTGCYDGIVRLWNLESQKRVAEFKSDNKLGVAHFCHDDKHIVTLDDAGTVRLWNLETRQEVRRWKQPVVVRESCAFLPDGRRFITVGTEAIHFWDLTSDKEIQSLRLAGRVDASALSADCSRLLYAVDTDNVIRLIQLPEGKLLATYTVASRPHGNMAISPDGRFAVGAAWDGTVHVWRLPDPPKSASKF